MALIFPRLAQNFIKNGYFPTDEDTLGRIIGALDIDAARIRIIDPCCGEGTALAEVKRHLSDCGAEVEALGIEYDTERAWHAKRLLDTVLHADAQDVFMSARSTGLLFLNPPYGQTVANNARTGDGKRSDRLELQFMRQTCHSQAIHRRYSLAHLDVWRPLQRRSGSKYRSGPAATPMCRRGASVRATWNTGKSAIGVVAHHQDASIDAGIATELHELAARNEPLFIEPQEDN